MSTDFISGTIHESTVYTPTAKGQYRAKIVAAEIVDPVLAKWAKEDDEEWRKVPLGRNRWKLLGDKNGGPHISTGRIIDQQVLFRPGANPKTGRSNLEALADLIRIRNNMTREQEVIGMSLFDTSHLNGLEKVQMLQIINQRYQEAVVGLEAVVIVGWIKVKGEQRDRVVKVVVPKAAEE